MVPRPLSSKDYVGEARFPGFDLGRFATRAFLPFNFVPMGLHG